MTAYAYLRKSVIHDPLSPGTSPVFQEDAVRRLAARHDDDDGLVILSDWDKSGRLGADKRPGYRALIDAIESGAATSVYSYSLSRLARSVAELSRLMARCSERGIPVRLEADSIDTSTASGMLTAHVLAAVAQFEADVASERVRAANASKLARGERIGSARFYGENAGDDPAAVLAAFREAGSYSAAAKLLNERRIPTGRGRLDRNGDVRGWWPSSVSVVVRRLDPTVRSIAKGARAGGSDILLARVMRCPTCDTAMTGIRDRAGARVRYACRMGTAKPHPRISIQENLILPAFMQEAARLVSLTVPDLPGEDERHRLELETQRTRVQDMYQAGDLDRTSYRQRLDRIANAEAALDARRMTMTLPEGIDWSKPTRTVNAALRALWRSVTLDPETFQPIAFEWTVPEWRR